MLKKAVKIKNVLVTYINIKEEYLLWWENIYKIDYKT